MGAGLSGVGGVGGVTGTNAIYTGAYANTAAVGGKTGSADKTGFMGKVGNIGQKGLLPLDKNNSVGTEGDEVKQGEKAGKVECQTCASRTYVDGSDDPGVSFKTPTKLSPTQAASAVVAHENEHVTRNAAEADRNDREVVSSSVSIYTSVCPECGKTYVSGGVTRTVTQKMKENDYFKNQSYDETIGKHIGKDIGKNVDEKV